MTDQNKPVTGRNESPKPPTANDRIAEQMRLARTRGGWSHAVIAEALTRVGIPTTPSTIKRIEAGHQAATVEQVLALALLMFQGGLDEVLTVPFSIGHHTVVDQAEVRDHLLAGDSTPGSLIHHGGVQGAMLEAIQDVTVYARTATIARALGRSNEDVDRASHALWQTSADKAVWERHQAAVSAQPGGPPAPDSPAWRAHIKHAIQQVTRDVKHYLEQEQR